MEDTAILELYWARDEQAIAETQKSYGKYCYSIAYHILHDREDTEECLNDTWMRAWNAIPPKKPNRLELFLGTITRNLSFDRWKAKNAQKRGNGIMDTTLDELAECIPAAHNTEEAVEAAELERSINAFLHTLSEQECNVFLRRYWFVEEYADRRALWNESEYGEDIAVPDQKKTAKISGTTGNRLIDGERDESGDEGYERL